jgi:hypothetical protein
MRTDSTHRDDGRSVRRLLVEHDDDGRELDDVDGDETALERATSHSTTSSSSPAMEEA